MSDYLFQAWRNRSTGGQTLNREEVQAEIDLATPRFSIKEYGAAGGGSGTTIAALGWNLDEIRAASGQTWLIAADSADLAAFYLAQAAADAAAGGVVYFPPDRYVFTATAFIHSRITVDLGGSYVLNSAAGDSRFVGARCAFQFGLFTRNDLPRFDAQGWVVTADDLALGALTITNITGPVPAPGDVLMIRTTSELTGGAMPLPTYSTFNEVASVDGTSVTLRWPVERAMTAPRIVNYNKITTVKQSIVPTGPPHVFYCAAHAALVNGTLANTAGGSVFSSNAMLDCTVDVRLDGAVNYGVYGNGFNRSQIRVAGTFGGTKGPVELGIGSALSTVEVDLRWSGVATDFSGEDAQGYSLVQFGECTEGCVVRGKLDGGARPCSSGLLFAQALNNVADLILVCRGAVTALVAFSGVAGCSGNRASGRFVGGTLMGYYGLWSSGGGGNNWIEGASFEGVPTGQSLLFANINLGGARGVVAPSGVIAASGSAWTGNYVLDSYVGAGVGSGTPPGNVAIMTAAGPWPETELVQAYNANTTLFNRQCYGRTVTNTGATAVRTIVLPASTAGMRIKAARDSAAWAFRVDPNGTETIGTGGAGKYLELQSDRAYVELVCVAAGFWIVASAVGTIGYEP